MARSKTSTPALREEVVTALTQGLILEDAGLRMQPELAVQGAGAGRDGLALRTCLALPAAA